ncbi:MAG: hypothetical protein J5929_00240 [Eubacterium sp.]|nr:hypothetical protein [Eubacterium sp.]
MFFKVKRIQKALCILLSVLLMLQFVQNGASKVEAAGPITDIKLTYNISSVDLNTAWPEGEVQKRFRTNVSLDSPSAKCKIDPLNCWLMYNQAVYPTFYPYGIYDGSSQVSSDKSYYFCFNVQLTDSIYDFCDEWKSCKEVTCLDDIPGHPYIYINDIPMPQFTYVKISDDGTRLDIYIRAFYGGKADTTEKVTGVTVDEDMKTMRPGMSHQFNYTVKGNSSDKSCKWYVNGANSSDTYFDSDGKLYVGEDETSDNLTCVAQSHFDSTKQYVFGIHINHKEDTEDIAVDVDKDNICLHPIYTQGEIASKIKDNIYINSYGLILELNNSGLLYKDTNGKFHVINDTDSEIVNPDREYFVRFALSLNDGYTLPSCYDNIKSNVLYPASNFKNDSPIKVNEAISDNSLISYSQMSGTVKLYVPLEFGCVSLRDLDNELTITGIADKVYTGKKIIQYPKIKMGKYLLREGVDYYLSYTDNINPGKASITIAGLGIFSGTIYRTFTILKESENGEADGKGKYKNEWVNGRWYDEFGNCTYDAVLSWKSNDKGWWVEDSRGWYPQSQWQKIDGKWYYFLADGYMDYSEYRDGCWLRYDGAWDEEYYGGHWMCDSTGWWYEDATGWYPRSRWVWIDGSCYYFGADGYMASNTYVDGCWVGADGAWVK